MIKLCFVDQGARNKPGSWRQLQNLDLCAKGCMTLRKSNMKAAQQKLGTVEGRGLYIAVFL